MFNLGQNVEEINRCTDVKLSQTPRESKIEELIHLLNSEENKPLIYTKPTGVVRSFCASSFQNDQDINFDKISIATNLKVFSKDIKININSDIPVINFFGIYDGHNGSYTSEKLRDKLIKHIIFNDDFLIRTEQSIINAFKKIDEEIKSEIIKNDIKTSISKNNLNIMNTESVNINSSENNIENSGSSALVCLTINDIFYVANLGTCQGIISSDQSSKIFYLTKEHSLSDENERERVQKAGGIIYGKNNNFRIKQGDLKSGRSIGDVHAKLLQTEDRPGIYLNIPDILQFKLTNKEDFIIFISDSIYEKLETTKIVRNIYECLIEAIDNNYSIDFLYSLCIQRIFKLSIKSGATGSLTCIILFFANFLELFINKNSDDIKEKLSFLNLRRSSHIEILNENIIKQISYEDQAGNNLKNIININDSVQVPTNQNNLIINNYNNRIRITKETKIYCCCFRKKKKIKNVQNSSQSNSQISNSFQS